jgi:2-desacetyl-2-hydroxyethyl bacteriochlorophyllide A dehydrogenase
MNLTMNAAILRGSHRIEIEERPVPAFGDDEVLVAVKSVAICGSDLHGFEGLIPQRRPVGITMGHEFSGIAAGVGRRLTHVREGDRIAVDPQISCGKCHACQQGWRNLCEQVQVVGSAMRGYRNGANAGFVTVPGENVYALPANVSFDDGALAEPTGNAIHLVRRTGIRQGSRVVVIGAGAIGSIAVQVAQVFGAETVTVIEPSAFKRRLATELGASLTIDPRQENAVEIVRQYTQGRGADVILECCGLQATYQMAIQLAAKRGVVGALGYIVEEVSFPMRPIIYSEISLIGSTGFYWPADPALEMIADGRVKVKPLITHTYPLSQAQQAYETAAKPEAIKVVIHP